MTSLAREGMTLDYLQDSPHVPRLISVEAGDDEYRITMEYINGQPFRDSFAVTPEWTYPAVSWEEARARLGSIAVAESDLLSRGAMYRDLNLDHLIFQNEKVVLVDHGSTVLRTEQDSAWYFHDQRGTWETMAPEEFRGYGELTERTATYRVAVISHLVLTGSLPFPRLPLRRDTHKWRRSHSPAISRELSDKTRHIFASALNRRSERRFKSPDAFFQALQASLKQ